MAVYHGGPCDGNPVFPPSTSETHSCQGHTYFRGGNGDYYATREGAFGSEGGSSGGIPGNARAHKGWHDLQVAVNRRIPTGLSNAQRHRRAALRKLRRRRR